MTTNDVRCLIGQADCGLKSGETQCGKCGLRPADKFVSREDRDLATLKATAQYWQNNALEGTAKIAADQAEIERLKESMVNNMHETKVAVEHLNSQIAEAPGKNGVPYWALWGGVIIAGMVIYGIGQNMHVRNANTDNLRNSLEQAKLGDIDIPVTDDILDDISNHDFAAIARKGRIDNLISDYEIDDILPETKARFVSFLRSDQAKGISQDTRVELLALFERKGPYNTSVVIRDKSEDRIALSNADFGELANDANGEIDIYDLRGMSTEKLNRLRNEISGLNVSKETKLGLQSLLRKIPI